jgi:hypothetical protein
MWIKMIKRLEWLKNTVNKYMADIRPDRLTTCQSERKSVVSRRPSVYIYWHLHISVNSAIAQIEAVSCNIATFLEWF